MVNDPIGKAELYQNYVSKSIPVVMRGDCSEWALKQELDIRNASEYLQSMF